MSALTLDDLQKGADDKYPDFEIEMEDGKVLGFKPILRLPKAKRKLVADALDFKKRFEDLPKDSDADTSDLMIAAFSDALKAAERARGDHAALLKWAGKEDLGMWLFIFEAYSEKTQLGEASPSES